MTSKKPCRMGWAFSLAAIQMFLLVPGSAAEGPWSFEVVNTSDFAANVSGGASHGQSMLNNLDLSAEFDMGPSGVERGTLFVYGVVTNAEGLNGHVGDAQGTSNIDNDALFRLEEFWYNQVFAGGDASVRIGLYDLNSEFDAIETAGLFIGSSHGIGTDFSQTGENGPSIFPTTSMALRLDYAFGERVAARIAVLDAVPNDPDNPGAHKLSFDEGALIVAEADFAASPDLRLGFGAWWYTGDFGKILVSEGEPDNDNFGFYGLADYAVTDSLDVWLRIGYANDEVNQLVSYLGAGIVKTGLWAARPDDALGLAVAIAENGGPFKEAALLALAPVDDREVAFELTYRARITDWLVLQPDLQYVLDPGMAPALEDALVATLRIEIGASF